MARWLKQSTSVDVPIGPFLDNVDGFTAETGLTLTQPDIRLKKNGGAWAQKNAAQTLSHEENGYYEVTLDTTDTNTLGLLRLAVAESGALPIWEDFLVVPANIWDSLFGSDVLDVSVTQFGGTNGTFASGRPEVNTSHIAGSAVSTSSAQLGVNVVNAAGTAWNSGAIGASTLATDTITAAKIAADAIGASELAADAVTEIQSGLATASALATVAGYIDTEIGTIITNLATVDTVVDAIQAKTDNLPSDPADASVIAARFDTLDTSVADLPTNAELATALGTADDAVLAAIAGLNNLSAAEVNAEVDTALADYDAPTKAELDSAVAPLALEATLAVVDGVADAVKAKTDSLTFTVAGQVDANIQYVNDVEVTGNGQSGTEWGPA